MITATPNITSYDQLNQQLVRLFGLPQSDFALRNQLNHLQQEFPDPRALRGIRLLDLGCGCERGSAESDANPSGTWAPWLCRAVQLLGGVAVGVDIGLPSPHDSFEYHRLNLAEPAALARFEGQSFDRINCTNLFSSPHLVYRLGLKERDSRAELLKSIEADCARLLKPDGRFLCFDRDLDSF